MDVLSNISFCMKSPQSGFGRQDLTTLCLLNGAVTKQLSGVASTVATRIRNVNSSRTCCVVVEEESK